MDWFLYDNGLRHERVKHIQVINLLFLLFTLSNTCIIYLQRYI